MKTLVAFLFAISLALAARETVQDAALSARKLLHKESILTISSIFSEDVNPALAGQPFSYLSSMTLLIPSLTEYYADCSTDGNPTLLLLNVEITTRNLNHGSPLSISISTTPPKGIYSVASLPRMNLNGRMTKIIDKNEVSAFHIQQLIEGRRSVKVLLISSPRRA